MLEKWRETIEKNAGGRAADSRLEREDKEKGGIPMKERLVKLLDVKSIVTFALIAVVCIQTIRQNVSMPPEFVASTVTAIVTYYFTRKDDSK